MPLDLYPIRLMTKNLLFPEFCRGCGRRLMTEENGYFCPTCWEMSPRIQWPFCCVCGRPHAAAVGFDLAQELPCADCREAPAPADSFRRVYGAAHYADAIGEAVRLLKFNDKRRLVQPLVEVMTRFAQENIRVNEYQLVIPVPLYKIRLRERGFNQAQLLAQGVLPCFPNAQIDEGLTRIRPTLVQSRTSSSKERRKNIAGAFAMCGEHTALDGQCVLLIDDVSTTRATIEECALVLRRAGAERVDAFVAALTLREHDPTR